MRSILLVAAGLMLSAAAARAESLPAPAASAAPAPVSAAPAPAPAKDGSAPAAKTDPAPDAKAEPAAAATGGAAAPVAPAAAAAEPVPAIVRIAVVPFDAPRDLELLGRSLADAVAQEAAKAPGREILGPNDVLNKLGPDAMALVAQCGENTRCYLSAGHQLGVDRVIGGWLDKAGTSYRFGMVHVDVKGEKLVARASRVVPIASRRIRADAVAASGPLLRGEAEGTGTLRISTEVAGAEVRVDDKPAGRTPLELWIPGGKHKVEVAQRGKVKLDPFWVDVPVGGKAEQKVRLYDVPVAERKPGEVETRVQDLGKSRKH